MRECKYYKRLDDGRVECTLCPHHCRIAEDKTGICRSRRNQGGVLVSEVYGKPCSLAIDPIEKKPLYHFHPGTTCLSLACTGCNFRCLNCQNHDISQVAPADVNHYELSPEDVVALCQKHHCPGIAYTYTEPLTWFEYTRDIARRAHEKGLWNVLVSAGYIEKEPLQELIPLIDAANIDLKAFNDDIYKKVCGASLPPVLRTLKMLHGAGVHLEITNLLVPQVNCDPPMIREMCMWLVRNKMADVPLHFSRFFPRYRMQDREPTSLRFMQVARQLALEEGIQTVHLGNV